MACAVKAQTTDVLTFCFTISIQQGKDTKKVVINKICTCYGQDSWRNVLTDLLDEVDERHFKTDQVTVSVSSTSPEKFHPDIDEDVSVLYNFDKTLKYVSFLIERDGSGPQTKDPLTTNVFEKMMTASTGTKRPPKKSEAGARFTAKDRLYNDICADLTSAGVTFPNSMPDDTVRKHVEVIAAAMWYIDGCKDKLNERAKHVPNSTPLPTRFSDKINSDKFNNYNEWKKKRQKAPRLEVPDLKKHSGAIFRLVSMGFTNKWGDYRAELEQVALALDGYATFHEESCQTQVKRQKLTHPIRQVGEHSEIQQRPEVGEVHPRYTKVDNILCGKGFYEYVIFNEENHSPNGSFKDFNERHFVLQKLQLTVPVDILTYSPGGQHLNVVLLWRTPEGGGKLNESMELYEKVRPLLPQFHTRQMKADFRAKYTNLGFKIPPAVLRNIYADLTIDASSDQNPALDERIRQAILADDVDLLTDLRHLNKGRPNDTFQVLFEKFQLYIEQLTAADERRHNVEHVSEFISIKDLIQQVSQNLEEHVPIPSESTVLFSFVPKNAHKKAAKLYKSIVPLQFKVQTRQLRSSHMDDHYCAAVFKYMRQYAIKYREECSFLCVDDKAKVDIGEPGSAVSTGVRGKKSIVPVSSTLSALDHDLQSKGH